MSDDANKKLAIKCIEDDDFRRRLAKDPVAVAAEIGVKLDDEKAKGITEALAKQEGMTGGVVSSAVSSVI